MFWKAVEAAAAPRLSFNENPALVNVCRLVLPNRQLLHFEMGRPCKSPSAVQILDRNS